MKLSEVKNGDTFVVAGMQFIKFTDEDGKVCAVAKDCFFYSSFDVNGESNFANCHIKKRIEEDDVPRIEAEIGAENLLEFELDLTALDGTKPFENVNTKVGLVTLDFYRKHREIFAKYAPDCWWWLATPDSESYKDIILCVSPSGYINGNFSNYGRDGVRPFFIFSSSILVS